MICSHELEHYQTASCLHKQPWRAVGDNHGSSLKATIFLECGHTINSNPVLKQAKQEGKRESIFARTWISPNRSRIILRYFPNPGRIKVCEKHALKQLTLISCFLTSAIF